MAIDPRIKIVEGDITRMKVDAIVNAANEQLVAGGGVDGAIHRAAGPKLQIECSKLGGCRAGEAKTTRGYDLPARFVIHTVGPRWRGGTEGEAGILESCYRSSLHAAASFGLKTIAFPAIGTGAFGYPKDKAAAIAVATVSHVIANLRMIETVWFVCVGAEMRREYEKVMGGAP